MRDVDQSVRSIRIVHLTECVRKTYVLIPVLDFVDRMLNVMYRRIFLNASASETSLEIRINSAKENHCNVRNISTRSNYVYSYLISHQLLNLTPRPANLHHVVQTANVA